MLAKVLLLIISVGALPQFTYAKSDKFKVYPAAKKLLKCSRKVINKRIGGIEGPLFVASNLSKLRDSYHNPSVIRQALKDCRQYKSNTLKVEVDWSVIWGESQKIESSPIRSIVQSFIDPKAYCYAYKRRRPILHSIIGLDQIDLPNQAVVRRQF